MKHKLLYFIPVAALFLAGCLGGKDTPAPSLSGTFTGQFRLFHRHATTSPFDTLKANVTLTMGSSPGNTFSITGDTATVHAGSKGTYEIATNGNFMLFIDSTIPKTGTSGKVHLNGEYIYSYDGSAFQLLASSGDTLQVQYQLRKN